MNKKQIEVEKVKLTAEEVQLNKLKDIYRKTADEIAGEISISNDKISALLKGWDNLNEKERSVYRSQIYRKQFQESLQKQVDAFLKDLNDRQHKSINEYLKDCYETGFIGSMYDIAGQGIPLIIPIDQKNVVKAMMLNPKISKTLYTALGENVELLKKKIAGSISRGIAAAKSYEGIARDISLHSNVGFNRAMRIARTEGHRVQVESSNDAQHAAKEAGADIVKQWDAALDGRTRPHHRQLDGQIRELDEPFEAAGMTAMYPSAFGIASEDINCRCALLQRAKWALDEDELETLKERAAYFGLDKTKDFGDFQKKYLKAADDIPLYKANITGGLKKHTEKEVKALTKEMGHIANKHTDIAGKWSGNIIVNDFVNTWGKKWNCDILTKMTTAPIIILHEQLHARSISLYSRRKGKKIYKAFAKIEEATVQLMAQEICKKENIIIIKSAYDNDVNILRQINEILKIENTDYEFGKQLIKVPVPERIDWLEKKVYNILMKNMKSVSIDNYERVNDLIEELR